MNLIIGFKLSIVNILHLFTKKINETKIQTLTKFYSDLSNHSYYNKYVNRLNNIAILIEELKNDPLNGLSIYLNTDALFHSNQEKYTDLYHGISFILFDIAFILNY